MTTQPVKPKSLKVWLGASIALNLFLIGAGVGLGYIANDKCKILPANHQKKPAMHYLTDGLSPDSSEKVRKIVTAAALDGESDMQAGRDHRNAAVKILLSDTPDAVAAQAEISKARAAESRAKDKIETAVVGLLIDLPAADRAIVTEHLVRTPFRARHKALHDLKKAEEAAAQGTSAVAQSKASAK
ncbi:periplasmic heavy metal sensor [Asticcacaulis tiandongensis]|uniref:periplasmic heavy metal sensor n=1 Tax=Asticcacaulis tiandongensis TaxID=2565365 RepID=UPI00112AC733|nr:periplasmic heavy metal sensor [Asticcacaulis tiandongensis]